MCEVTLLEVKRNGDFVGSIHTTMVFPKKVRIFSACETIVLLDFGPVICSNETHVILPSIVV